MTSHLLALALLIPVFGCAAPTTGHAPRSWVQNVADTRLWLRGEVSDENLALPALYLQLAQGPVTFWIDSPGGDVGAGLAFIEEMRATQRRGIQVTCVVDGMAASMAAVILEGCDLRLMTPQSSLLFHTVSIAMAPGGNQWTYERLVQQMKEYNKRLAIFVVGRLNISLECYEAHVANKDWWLGWEEALDVGAVDGVYDQGS